MKTRLCNAAYAAESAQHHLTTEHSTALFDLDWADFIVHHPPENMLTFLILWAAEKPQQGIDQPINSELRNSLM